MYNRNINVHNKNLAVLGTSMTPQPSPRASPSPPVSPDSSRELHVTTPSIVVTSDDDSENSVEYTVLDSVKEMTELLEKQLAEIRKQIVENEQIYNDKKAKIVAEKESKIREKDAEIDAIEESLHKTQQRNDDLKKIVNGKDKAIRETCREIDALRTMIDDIKVHAKKIQKQVEQVNRRTKAEKQKHDAVSKQKNEEIQSLTEEMESLKSKLANLEEALSKAILVIREQNQTLNAMEADKLNLQTKFKEDLNALNMSTKKELGRLCEIMQQNMEEIRAHREQNKMVLESIHKLIEVTKENREANRQTEARENHDTKSYECVKLPSIPQNPPPNPKRENSQIFFIKSIQTTDLQRTRLDISNVNDNPHSGSSPRRSQPPKSPRKAGPTTRSEGRVRTIQAHNHFLNVVESFPNGGTPKTGNTGWSTQIINDPHVPYRTGAQPPRASLNETMSAKIKQPPGGAGKPVV